MISGGESTRNTGLVTLARPGILAAESATDAVIITDPIFLLTHLFLGVPDPVEPFPECGPGTEADRELCDTPPKNCQQ